MHRTRLARLPILCRRKEVVCKVTLRLRRSSTPVARSDMPGNCNPGPHERYEADGRDGEENLHVP